MIGGKPRDDIGLDMPFGEALERYIGVDPKELEANIAKDKGKKPPGAKKKRKAPGAKVKSENVLSLKERRESLRRRGLT
jgi:hypothetical protein